MDNERNTSMITFTKLQDGSWGVRVPHSPVPFTSGQTVEVITRNGASRNVVLADWLRNSEQNGQTYQLWTLAPQARTPAPAAINVGELSAIYALFAKAKQTLKFPAVELSVEGYTGIRISVAGDKAREPGSLTVTSVEKFDEEGAAFPRRRWYGRISKDGTFQPSREMNPAYSAAVAARLAAFAADPAKVGGEDGRLHGNCCFCRKALSDERSTLAGYGAKCATNWGLAWGTRPSTFACAEVV